MNPAVIDQIKREIDMLCQANPELADDAELRHDMIEGETGVHQVVGKLIAAKVEADAMVAAIKAVIETYTARMDRYQANAHDAKAGITAIMQAANLPKLTLPQGTVSISKGRDSVAVDNADELPQGFFAIERKPMKNEIKIALQAGEAVPGARLVTGPETVTVRTR